MMDAFTEDEKRFVLAEYIKASQVETDQLVEFIKAYNLQADWFAMQLPGGRNMHQCMRAASQLLDRELQLPSLPNLKRKSVSDFSEHVPKRVASMTPIQYQPRPPPLPQPLPLAQPQPQLQPQPQPQPQPAQLHQPVATSRAIQPRPSSDPKQTTAEGYGVFQSKSPSNGYGVFQSNPTVRKRGRPSKAEKEAQARANSANYPTSTPVPISPKPAISPAAATTPVVSHASTRTAYHTATRPPDSRPTGGGNTGVAGEVARSLPKHYTEQAKSEKSPSIGNLVTPEPAREPHRGSPPSLVRPAVRDPPPVTNSA
ncbi:hypothetical protein KVR01_013471 [Diaporthe batatas]|uniref:uncharacterized protein n=1 Tax=Diaporthe batatas TaxID=748121 RepID=UPI001D037890|nr:uncharacterized protein KVR01_013471 [Diaporthe batatas]KAG8156680.1 hypothetical protein KVR01_013471 [Diaporthe batatas]